MVFLVVALLCLCVVLAAGRPPARAADFPAVIAVDDSRQIVIDNGIIALTISKRGANDSSIRYHSGSRTIELTDAGLLKPGQNQITLGHTRAIAFSAPLEKRQHVFGQVMYDAIRLEVQPLDCTLTSAVVVAGGL